MPTMTLVIDPPDWNPPDVDVAPGDKVTFETSDGSTQTIEIVPPPPEEKFDQVIPSDWQPPGMAGTTYRVIWHYKGGATTGHVNVSVGSGDGKAS